LEEILFVIGFFRSGTSLLYTLLNQHPAIALTYEANVLKFWPAIRNNALYKDWGERLEFWNQTFSRHCLDFTQVSQAQNRHDAALALYRAYASRKGASIIGAKAPVYQGRVVAIASEFPAAKFIILWRSPWEILRSIRRAGRTTRFFAAPTWAQYTAIGVKQLLYDCESLRASNRPVFQLNYRLLIADRAKTFRSICEFLNIPFNEKMITLEGADTSAVPPGDHHATLRSSRISIRPPEPAEEPDPTDLAILEKAFGYLKNPPWTSGSPDDVAKDAARCAAEARRSFPELCRRVFYENRDSLVRFICAYAPLSMLNRRRALRNRRFAAKEEVKSER
jgi:Sulfotransferase family